MAAVSKSLRPLLRLRAIPSCLPRRCASSSPNAAKSSYSKSAKIAPQTHLSKPASPPQTSRTPSTKIPSIPALDSVALRMKELPPEQAKKQWYAQQLYASGRTVIYRPPSHVGIYVASWLIGTSTITAACLISYVNLVAPDGPDLPVIVPIVRALSIIIFSAIGGVSILRSMGIIRSIDLVSVDGLVKMAVQVRRPLPFLPPKEHLIAPYQFHMNRKFVRQMEYPEFMLDDEVSPSQTSAPSRGILSRIGRGISRGLYYPFASTRRLLTLEGFMWVSVDGGTQLKLDTQGGFSNGDKDIKELGTILI